MTAVQAQETQAPAKPRRRILSALVVLVLAGGLWWVMAQADQLTSARRQLPAGCLEALAEMDPAVARSRGVPLRECARRKLLPEHKTTLIGRWDYGIGSNYVDGYIAQVRHTDAAGLVHDRLMHVSVIDNYARLNEFNAAGTSCAGGIATATVKGGVFTYVVNLTAEGLLRFAGHKVLEQVHRDGDLETSPQVCVGRLTVTDRRPVMVELNARALTADGNPAPITPAGDEPVRQACFNTLVGEYNAAGQGTLSFPSEYTVFVTEYIARCTDGPVAEKEKPASKSRKKSKSKARKKPVYPNPRYY